MDIAVIGAGNVGRALAAAFSRAGHTVAVASSDVEDAEEVARAAGVKAAASNREAVEGAEIVVLAVPYPVVESVLGEIDDVAGKILIDVTNRAEPADPASVIDGTSNAEGIQAVAPQARVLKAFNTVFAARQADPVVEGVQLDGFVAGDDEDAKKTVLELVSSVGLRPIDVGGLGMARALEAMATLNIMLQISNGWSWQMGWKLVGPTT